jgi:hypothetical protein
MDSKAKSSNISVLVDQYTRRLKKYLKTGKGKPDPQSFMNRHAKKTRKHELQIQLTMTTLLTLYGREQSQKAQKALKNGDFLEKSKQKFFDNLKKSSGAS